MLTAPFVALSFVPPIGGKYIAYGLTDSAAPGTFNLLAAVGAFVRIGWQQNVASLFDGKGASVLPHLPYTWWVSFLSLTDEKGVRTRSTSVRFSPSVPATHVI